MNEKRISLEENYGYIFEKELIDEIMSVGILKTVAEGETFMDIGDTIQFIPLLLSGAIKISRLDDHADELLLYFIEKGDVCAMTLTCCMGQSQSEIKAIAESRADLILIPVQNMNLWLQKYNSWRTFVFESYNNRFKELLESIDSLAFMNMHERILKYLRDKVLITKDVILNTTHHEVAADLNTSRVVVSRILKSLERDNKIKLHRNRIEYLNF